MKQKPREKITLQELLELTYERHWRGTKGEKSALINANKVIDILGCGKDITTINTKDIDKLVATLETLGNTSSTINRKLSSLSKMLKFAHQREYITNMPHIDYKTEVGHRLRWVNEAEEQLMLKHFECYEPMRVLIILAIDTGMRLGELLQLEKRDIDLEGGWVHVWTTKTNRPRSIPLTNRVRGTLARFSGDSNSLFNLNSQAVNYQWHKMLKAIGMAEDKDLVFHSLRHTFCSRLLQRGVQIVIVKELAGHSSIQTTLRYAHLSPVNLATAIEVLNH